MIFVTVFLDFSKEVHVVEPAQFILIEESNEPFQLSLSELVNHPGQDIEQLLASDLASVSLISFLECLNERLFSIRVDLSVNFLVDRVTVVHSLELLPCEVPHKYVHWHSVLIVFDLCEDCSDLHI